ncbi:MAG: hypothetical protein Q9228_002752 [Teloschistes exilis]
MATDQPSSYPSRLRQSILQPRSPAYTESGAYDMDDECIGLKITVGILVTVLVIILFAAAIWIWKDRKRNGQGDGRVIDHANMELETHHDLQSPNQSARRSVARAETAPGPQISNEETTYVSESHHVPNPIHVDETAYHPRWYGDTGRRVGEAQDAFQPAPTLHPRLTPSSEYSQPTHISAVPPSATDYNYNAAEASASTTGNRFLLR